METMTRPDGEIVAVELTLFDYCDAEDGSSAEGVPLARAYVLVQLPSGTYLAFCKHHYERMEASLLAAGAIVVDDKRADLEVKPGVSAAS